MAEDTLTAVTTAATALAEAKGKLTLAEKELASAQKRVTKRQGELALAEKGMEAAIQAARQPAKK